ncbi:hypothetical protein WMO13_00645 [Ignatzschineria larvae DSM 13226]|uniref:5-bromo-4-chloroindolyl phosphate hydrolysis protein n=1 Tax=Ignatzschineria larvae DSM 13226 TaxID=1111732 RepID=A0ABZ3C0B1_9GAMM|nr:hypothetical protein [Ignatzschineria larvae]
MEKNSNLTRQENYPIFNVCGLATIALIGGVIGVFCTALYLGKVSVTTALNLELGVIINALIIGFFAYQGAKLALKGVQQQNQFKINVEVISKNRQDWINDLRTKMAEYLNLFNSPDRNASGNIHNIDSLIVMSQKKEKFLQLYYYIILLVSYEARTEKNDQVTEYFIKTLDLSKNLFLVNDSEFKKSYSEKIKKILEFNEKSEFEDYLSIEIAANVIEEQLIICTQKLLKQEWERVKKGE